MRVPVVLFEQPKTVEGIGEREVSVARARCAGCRERLALADAQELAAAGRITTVDKKPTVAFLYMRGQAGVYLIGGKGSGADSMIKAAGGVERRHQDGLDEPFTPITPEALVEAAPEVILMTTTGLESVGGVDRLVKIPGIAQTPAGKNRRIVTEEDGLLFSFGRARRWRSRLAEALHQANQTSREAPGTTGADVEVDVDLEDVVAADHAHVRPWVL
jgi:iron complex transport system substrate-binding protein